MLQKIKNLIPKAFFESLRPTYHYLLAFLGAVIYGFPSMKIKVVAVTGTKGKSSTIELLNQILEKAQFETALSSTIRIKIAQNSEPNLKKMTMPGRFFLQKFLRQAVEANCDYALVEMTSEGAKEFRHKFIDLDALIFLNLSPEHIESHGSYENYLQAKLMLAEALQKSKKGQKVLVVNGDDKESLRFMSYSVDEKYSFSILNATPYKIGKNDMELTFRGSKITSKLIGKFNIYNILAASTYASSQNIPIEIIASAIESVSEIKGRVQKIKVSDRQNFEAVVDYAHTPDSLLKLYLAFFDRKKICVLGNTGGGRDKWKRAEMAKIADRYCDSIILTNEDPYDDDPMEIVSEMKSHIVNKPCQIIMDRRQAIIQAIKSAKRGFAVLLSGKGTDPYIMGKNGSKMPWNEAEILREEIENFLKTKKTRRSSKKSAENDFTSEQSPTNSK